MPARISSDKLEFVRVDIHEVVVPARRDILSAPSTGKVFSGSTTWDQLSIFVVEAQTSHGFSAVGEAHRGASHALSSKPPCKHCAVWTCAHIRLRRSGSAMASCPKVTHCGPGRRAMI
jgi:hypothetical protein